MREYDPYAYEMHEDPYPTYARAARRSAPLYRNERLGFWALSRHADVLAGVPRHRALLEPERRLARPARRRIRAPHAMMSFLAMDPPRHTRMRALGLARLHAARGSPSSSRASARSPRGHIDAFIAARAAATSSRDFAGKLPMDVISEMLGVPQADRDQLRGVGRHRRAPRGGHDRRAAGRHGGGDAHARLLRSSSSPSTGAPARRPDGARCSPPRSTATVSTTSRSWASSSS